MQWKVDKIQEKKYWGKIHDTNIKMVELNPSYNLKQMKVCLINQIKLNESKTRQYVVRKSKRDRLR